MSVTAKTKVGVIDCTPSWKDILGTLVVLLEGGNADGRAVAIAELTRMAKLADAYVAAQKVQP